AVAPQLRPRRAGRPALHRCPQAEPVPSRARHRIAEFPRPRPRHHDRAMAPPRPPHDLGPRASRPHPKPFPTLPEPRQLARSPPARGMSVVRTFVRFLERRHLAASPALAVLRAPKLPQSVPKPLTPADALATLAAAGDFQPSAWQGKRDIAILTLLYGCGLRISEALGLKRGEAPHGELLAITGKGGKDR